MIDQFEAPDDRGLEVNPLRNGIGVQSTETSNSMSGAYGGLLAMQARLGVDLGFGCDD